MSRVCVLNRFYFNSIEVSADPYIADLFAEFFQSIYIYFSWSNSNYSNHLNKAKIVFLYPLLVE